jgi:hypothetical protein
MSDWLHTVKVPKQFWEDHKDRDCVADAYSVKVLKWHYVLTLTEHDVCELLSDAHHYASSASDFGFEMQGIVSSARATKNAILKQVGAEALAEMWMRVGFPTTCAKQMRLPITNN